MEPVEPALWGLIGTFVGTIIGATASILATVIANKNQLRLQENNVLIDRQKQAREFQRDNLLKVQDVMLKLLRYHAQEYFILREGGDVRLPDELDENLRYTKGQFTIHVERISDDSLRSELKSIHGKLNSITNAKSAEEIEYIHINSNVAAIDTMKNLGKVLRNLY